MQTFPEKPRRTNLVSGWSWFEFDTLKGIGCERSDLAAAVPAG
jgi:hypothetical protein